MNRVVLLDAGPIGLVTNPRRSPPSTACARWLQQLLTAGWRVLLPEIADYEVRRELLRAGKQKGLDKLDALGSILEYLPITSQAMRQAAVFWAEVRQLGRPTAAEAALDADAILAGQAASLQVREVVIATTNVGHLARFVPADLWENISVS